MSTAFSPNREYLESGSIYNFLESIERKTHKNLTSHFRAVFSTNLEYLASGSDDWTINIWKFLSV